MHAQAIAPFGDYTSIQHQRPTQTIEYSIPETISLERAHTLNGYGYVFYMPSPLLADFLEYEAKPGKKIFEVGAGFGNAPIEAIKKGVSEYTANDLSDEHLQILKSRLQNEQKKDPAIKSDNLKLLPGQAPEALPTITNYYDAILIDKVLHFFSPDQIRAFLNWSFEALKNRGKLYVLTISPCGYKDKVLPIYEANKQLKSQFPGHLRNADELMNKGNYQVPKEMVFFMLDELIALFERNGFDVFKKFSLQVPTESHPFWKEVEPTDSTLVGLVVQKR